MKPRNRSLSGALIAVLALPVFLGLLACIPSFPVPIGDAEKARIDPAISGMWVAGDADDLAVWWFIPYDKRSWLVTMYSLEADVEFCEPEELPTDSELTSYQDIRDYFDEAGSVCLVASPVMTWKAWKTELGGRDFITFENKTYYVPDDPDEEWWMVYGVSLPNPDLLRLMEMDSDSDAFADIDKDEGTRRQYERVFRKQAKDSAFYETDAVDMYRVQDDDLEMFGEVVLDVFEM
jgi:hypothetical protein